MTPDQRNQLKETIQSRLAELDETLNKENDETKPIAPDVAIGRLSRLDSMQSQQMALELQRRQQTEANRLRDILRDIDGPSFGICPLCRKEIAFARLEAMPTASLCVECSP